MFFYKHSVYYPHYTFKSRYGWIIGVFHSLVITQIFLPQTRLLFISFIKSSNFSWKPNQSVYLVLAVLPFHQSEKDTFTPAILFSVSVLQVYCRKIDNTDREREENKHHKPTIQRENSERILYLRIPNYIYLFVCLKLVECIVFFLFSFFFLIVSGLQIKGQKVLRILHILSFSTPWLLLV